MRYRLFRRKSNNNYYFQFLTDDEQPILNSQGYTDKDARNNGLTSVIKNAGNAQRYENFTNADGTFSFIVKAANGQEIGRSPDYDTETARDSAIALFQTEVPGVQTIQEQQVELTDNPQAIADTTTTATTTAEELPYEARGNEDNYKPLSFYETNGTAVQDGFDSFEVDGLYYFSYKLGGNVYLISEGYTSEAGFQNGIESVTKNMAIEDRYQRERHPNGQHYFNLRAGNNKEIATSRWFGSDREMNGIIARMIAGLGLAGKSVEEGTQLQAANRTASISIASAIIQDTEDKPKKKRKKRTTEKKPKVEKVYLADGAYLFNDITYQIFRSGNDKHYFTFKDKDGKTIFLNADVRGFDTQEEAQAVVDEIMKYGPYEINYDGKMAKNGKYYFYLKGKDGENLAKSFFYNSEEEMQESVGTLLGTELQIAAAKAAAANRIADDYLECKTYYGEAGFHRFSHESEHYFSYNDGNGETVLRSEGYTTEAARENGISSVITNAALDERWKTGTALNDRYHFFSLRAGNNQEIARSCYYDSEENRNNALNWVRGHDSTIGKGAQQVDGVWWSASMIRSRQEEEAAQQAAAAAAALAAASPDKITDDYLTCKSYYGQPEFNRFKGEDGEYYFSYNDKNGETILRSEGYTTEAARENGINSVIKNAPIEERWIRDTAMNGKYHFFALRAGNNQEIARSCYYEDEAAMLAAWGWVRGEESSIGVGSRMVDGALMSAALFSAREREEAEAAAAEAKRLEEEENQRKEAAAVAAAAAAAALAAASPDKITDDYLTCKSYYGQPEFNRFKGEDGEYYFSYNDKNGETILRSEGYTTEAARENGINSVIKNAPIEERWIRDTAMNGKYHFFALRAGNNQEIARSCYYEDEAAMLAAWGWVRGEESSIGVGSRMVGGALMSAALFSAREREEAEAAAAAEAKRLEEEENKRKEAAAVAAAAAAAALAARQKEEAEAAALAAREKAEAEAAAAAAEARRLEEEENKRKEAAAVAAAAAAAALAARQKEEAAALAARQREEELQRNEKAAAAAATAAAALAANEAARKRDAAAAAAVADTGGGSRPFLSGLWPWLLALLLLLLLLWLFRGCFGCGNDDDINANTATPTTEVPADNSAQTSSADTATTEMGTETGVATAETPEPLGPNAAELGFVAGTIEADLANCLSDPNCDLSQTFTWDGTQYPFNSAKMDRGALPHVDNIAKLLKAYPNANIDIYGYIDGNESDIYRGPYGDGVITLSGIRARCLYKKLAKRGIEKSRMTFEGFGDARPIADNDTEQGRRKNRRTEIKIRR